MSLTERYELIRIIGAGGMAQVFEGLAHGAEGFRRRVAIKRLVPEHAGDESYQRMFVDEARIVSHLHHANIVQVLDYGTVDGQQFLVLEYVDGPDASRAARIGARAGARVPADVALHIVAEVGHALHYAHTCSADGTPLKIVHRDVSPGNVLLSWDGDVKLSDFGIALASGRQERTRTGMVKGKLDYMAPEQAEGRPLTGAADVYALGATLAALLFGAPQQRDRDPGRAQAYPEGCALVARCMAEVPSARPSAAEVAEQAEALRAKRGYGAGRGELRRWLAALRPQLAPPGEPHAFDRMLGLCLVPARDGTRGFTISEARTRNALPLGKSARRGSVLRRPLLVVGLIAAVAAGVISVALLTRPAAVDRPARPPAAPPVTVPPVVADSMTLDVATSADAGAVESSDASPPPVTHRRRQPRAKRVGPPPPRTKTAKPRSPAPGSGWLRVGGAALLRAEILVDGKRVGRAPAALQLPRGVHRLQVRAPDGRTLVDEQVTIEETHRRSTPLKLIRRQ